MPDATDLLGNAVTQAEAALLEAYEALKRLASRDDLAPSMRAGAAEALSSLWQVVNDLALTDERPDV